ncbi:ATP-binding protein [Actinoallomurus bryophytorum]|uniref:AAA ATPase-like protein n=1 Tax=Actinoallomurus bryophytorum TaxID=1490222 RepID=A0A543CJ62_9ACTN|nr:AAA family ATPase [Actinoallomurus bryophytorum]TQL97138.1 AAA ATPase-like protein [Actinoallomurus bryophytorum]
MNPETRRFTSLAERLRAARQRTFVGRAAELDLFRAALDDAAESFAVQFLTGPGGIGKSTLLRRFAEEAAAAGRTVVEIDGHQGSRTPEAFEADAATMFTHVGAVLLVDDFEAFEPIEDWLRERFLPRLPAGALVVLAGRRPPDAMWLSDPGWEDVLRVIAVGDLPRADAVALLTARGVPSALHPALLTFAGGHPLALSLAASAERNGEGEDAAWTPPQDVVGALLTRLVGQVPSPVHRQALEVSAHVRTTTEGLLRDVLPEADAAALFAWLRQLSFMEPASSGIRPHDVIREILDIDLSWRDPQRYEDMHRGLIRHFVAEVRAGSDPVGFAQMEALLYLLWDGSSLFSERDAPHVHEDVLRSGDRDTILEIAAKRTNEETAAIVGFWLERRPETFAVFRDSVTGEPAGYMVSLRLTAPDDEENSVDPVVAEAWSYVRRMSPLRDGEHLAIVRCMLSRDSFPSPVGDLIAARVATIAIRSEGVAWICLVLSDPDRWKRFAVFGEQDALLVSVGDRTFGLLCRNWQETSPEAWLEQLKPRRTSQPVRMPHDRFVRRYEVLSRAEFDAAVRGALRSWNRPDALANSPLIPTRVVAEAGPEPVDALRRVLRETVERLDADPRDAKLHRAITMTFMQNTPTQQAAADRLGLPFSTYRRHLTRGLDRVCELLWRRELLGERR